MLSHSPFYVLPMLPVSQMSLSDYLISLNYLAYLSCALSLSETVSLASLGGFDLTLPSCWSAKGTILGEKPDCNFFLFTLTGKSVI